ncbi:RICIN domain-containing protein [Streptomyces sp. NPDC004296]|uniref:RICIN domain-containing protein n=1 Tax=Streptomyces sp. NPDC004296 TaxID=3364697 RepID=UPI0036C582C1
MIGKVSKVPWRSVVTAAATAAVLSPLMGVPQAAAASGASTSQEEPLRIVTFADKCLTVSDGSAEDGAVIDQYPCVDPQNPYAHAQKFTFVQVSDGRYKIKTFAGKCLTVSNESTANSAVIDQYRCEDLAAQKFRIRPILEESGYSQILTFVDKCLTVWDGSAANSAVIDQYPCVDPYRYAQKFRIQPPSAPLPT